MKQNSRFKRLPDLIQAYAEFHKEIERIQMEYRTDDIIGNFSQLKMRDVDFRPES